MASLILLANSPAFSEALEIRLRGPPAVLRQRDLLGRFGGDLSWAPLPCSGSQGDGGHSQGSFGWSTTVPRLLLISAVALPTVLRDLVRRRGGREAFITLDGRVGLLEESTHVVGEARKVVTQFGYGARRTVLPCISIGLLPRTAIGGVAGSGSRFQACSWPSRRPILATTPVHQRFNHTSAVTLSLVMAFHCQIDPMRHLCFRRARVGYARSWCT
jgi:hypothetical protein